MTVNRKSLQKIESKERILNVASRLFKKNGYAATGIDEIMAEAGLTAGGFYSHFKSKVDLLEQSIEHSLKNSARLLLKDTENIKGVDKINLIMRKYVSFLHRDLVEKGCILPALGAEIYRSSKKSRRVVADYIEKWADILAQELPDTFDNQHKRAKALALISQAVGAILLSRLVGADSLSESIINSVEFKK